MAFVLSSENVLDYLVNHQLIQSQDQSLATITAQEYRNFNLIVRITSNNCLLVKQERLRAESRGHECEFWREQKIYDLFQSFPELYDLFPLTSEVIYFDPENHIIVLCYFSDYCNLNHFYANHRHRFFPIEIATSLGSTLARVHRKTWEQSAYQAFLVNSESSQPNITRSPSFLQGLARFNPNIFSKISTDGLNFWRLYQRYESLHQAVVAIAESYQPSCLIHYDLEFRNILVKAGGYQPENASENTNCPPNETGVRLIDWEMFRWGDPAYDLGVVLACYLGLWLDSLVVSKAIPIQTALKLAATPLEILQPSITALLQSYLQEFPEILNHQADFIQRVVQFTGLVFVKQIQTRMERLYSFDNRCICTLQVAKMLLCNPEQSFLELFGTPAAHLTHNLVPREGVLVC